jgi:8-amino-7-oxononanoate synthase
VSLIEHCRRQLDDLAAADLVRRPRTIAGPQGPRLQVDGRPLLCFSSNNYLGFADHPALLDAARRSLEVDGLGAGASRLITGTMDAHQEAEVALASFVRAEAALLFSTGYAANVGALQALAGPDTLVFSDALNHASLIDGARLSRARVHVYRHADVDHLEALLREHRAAGARAIVVTDALFSMDGDLAPVRDLRAVADRHDAALFVDEAHALGVLGPSGRGLCAREGVRPDVLVGTLGKSFGGAGAFVAGDRPLRELLLHRARSFVFSTAPLPLLARVATAAARLVLEADDRRAALAAHTRTLRTRLPALGFDVPPGDSPIVPVLLGEPRRALEASAALYEAGFLAQAIRPPTVPPGTSRIRLVPMATHTPEDVDALVDAFAALPRSPSCASS